jgi:5-methylcytosine-specific restriction endonuclease McrA
MIMATRICKKCGVEQPLNKDHFGHQPNGNFLYTCRQCKRDTTRKHYREKPEFQAVRIEKRRALVEAVGAITKSQEQEIVRALVIEDGKRCYYCKKPLTLVGDRDALDHKTPLAKGGANNLSNFALACFKCNQEKHNKTVDEYRKWLIDRNYKPKF